MAVDSDRLRAFRIIIEDIEQNGDRYNNKGAQTVRIGELIGAQDLKMRPKGEQVQTPTAARLRDAFREWASRSNASSKSADVFFRGRDALDTTGRTKLGLAATVEDGMPSSVQTKNDGLEGIAAQNEAEPEGSIRAPAKDSELPQHGDATRAHKPESTASRPTTLPGPNSKNAPAAIAIEDSEGSDFLSPSATSPKAGPPVDDGRSDRYPSRGKRSATSAFGEEAADGTAPNVKRHKIQQAFSAAQSLDSKEKDTQSLKRKRQAGGEEPAASKRPKRAAAPSDFVENFEPDADSESAEDLLVSGTTDKIPKSMATASTTAASMNSKREREQSGTRAQPAQQEPSISSTHKGNRLPPSGVAEARPTAPSTAEAGGSGLPLANGMTLQELFDQASGPQKMMTGYPEGLAQVDARKDVDRLVWRIRNANSELLESVGLKDEKASMPNSPNPDLTALYTRILRRGFYPWKEQAIQLMNEGFDLDYWLNACAGAAVYDQVLIKPVPWKTPQQYLADLKHTKKAFEDVLRFFSIRDQRLGNIEYFMFRIGEQQISEDSDFEREHILPVAKELALDFMMLLVQQIKHVRPDVVIPEPALEDAKSSYIQIFKDALFLRGRCEVGPTDFDFVWEQPLAKFDRETISDVRGLRWNDNGNRVQVCTFAAVRSRDEKKESGWWYHSQARVYAYTQAPDKS
ncbi:hypothetical protein BST61_g3769 [Cercospora zeina]